VAPDRRLSGYETSSAPSRGCGLTTACGSDDPPAATPALSVPPRSVQITSPADKATVTSPIKIVMAATGFAIEPAGPPRDGAGHFHVMVDVGCVSPGAPIPVGATGFNHFGKAQTETELTLEPGEHRLCLQAGDGTHVALGLTDEISVVVAPS